MVQNRIKSNVDGVGIDPEFMGLNIGFGSGPRGMLNPALFAPELGNPVPLFDTIEEAEEFSGNYTNYLTIREKMKSGTKFALLSDVRASKSLKLTAEAAAKLVLSATLSFVLW